jgi:hypothetical protein
VSKKAVVKSIPRDPKQSIHPNSELVIAKTLSIPEKHQSTLENARLFNPPQTNKNGTISLFTKMRKSVAYNVSNLQNNNGDSEY